MYRGLLLLVVVACRHAEQAAPVIDRANEPAWRETLLTERANHDRELKTDDDSPLAGVDRFDLEATSYVRIDGDDVHIDQARDAAVVTFEKTATGWSWQPASDAVTATTHDGKAAISPGPITKPTLIHLSPRFTLNPQLGDGDLIVIAFDHQRRELREFAGLAYFAPDPRFVVRATLHRAAKPIPTQLITSRGLYKHFDEIGTLQFELAGPRSLVAYQMAGMKELFVPFVDATSGKASYGAARFLDLSEPDANGTVVIDFNRAYNPLCAFSPAYNCPLPTDRSRLAIEIEAGERDPHLH